MLSWFFSVMLIFFFICLAMGVIGAADLVVIYVVTTVGDWIGGKSATGAEWLIILLFNGAVFAYVIWWVFLY